ncbi:MAG: arylsulfatase A-like enzyme [Myxococcota bacterium]|jgi:arylsulfatase A-like enzyme
MGASLPGAGYPCTMGVILLVLLACGSGPTKPGDSGVSRPPGTGTTAGTTPAGTTPGGTPAGTTPAGTTPAGTTPAGTTPTGRVPPNVLLVVADDLGVDFLSIYGATGAPVPATPTLDALASEGVRFADAWSSPLCSPTRSELLTGRRAWRWGLGTAVRHLDSIDFPPDAITLPEVLGPGWGAAFVGKWHLTAGDPALTAPLDQGFDHWSGTLGNIGPENSPTRRSGQTYTEWERVEDGVLGLSKVYATTDTVDDALVQVRTLPEPWFVEVAFNAGHSPYHFPDPSLLSRDWRLGPSTQSFKFGAMIEALDTELGRLLTSLPPDVADRTIVVFVGDNGTPGGVVPEPAKGTVYQAGVHVPLLVRGPGVAAGVVVEAPVDLVDLPATVADLAGVGFPEPVDGVSLVPCLSDPGCRPRETGFAYAFTPNGPGPYVSYSASVRDGRYKLLEGFHEEFQPFVSHQLFDLDGAGEAVDLLAGTPAPDALAIRDRLLAALDAHLDR